MKIYKKAFHHGAPLCRYLARSTAGAAAFDRAVLGFLALALAAGFLVLAIFSLVRALVTLAVRPRTDAVVERAVFFFEERDELLVFMGASP